MPETNQSRQVPFSRWAALLLLLLLPLAEISAQLHTPRHYVSRAEESINAGSWHKAKAEIDKGLATYPSDPDLRYLNGRYYYQARNMQEARYNLVRAIHENDQHFKAKRLLVDVEDEQKHYSSAICYINELLEFQPYDRDLWRRKISLYRKLDNHAEADAALERLAHIYPNDPVVRQDQRNRNRETWNDVIQKNSLSEAADNLEKWLDLDPRNRSYYVELTNIYLRMGMKDRAMGTVNRGLAIFPNDSDLKTKMIGILTSMGLHTQALAFAKKQGMGAQIYSNLMQEVADEARLRDPYEVHGRIYEQTKDAGALTYLLNTSLARGYLTDARFYLAEAMKRQGRTVSLLSKLYDLEKREGNEQAMMKILLELYEKNPSDGETTAAYVGMVLELANRDIAVGGWADAVKHLDTALGFLTPQDEAWASAVSRKITALGRLGRFSEARTFCLNASSDDPSNTDRFISAYEELIANRLRFLVEEERFEEALDEADKLLLMHPHSETALRCCINMTQSLKRNDDFRRYAAEGFRIYPAVPYFIVKQAIALSMSGKYDEAVLLLESGTKSVGWENPQLVAARSGLSYEWASILLKERMSQLALDVADSALVHDPSNKELLCLKGLAYEQLKHFGKAYDYQFRYYNPSNAEQQDWYEHMRYLRFSSFKNRVDVSYTHAVYDTRNDELASVGHLYSLATMSYSWLDGRDTYTGQLTYKGVDGYSTGGETERGGYGVELKARWDRVFTRRWSGTASIGYATRFLNKVGVDVGAAYAADHDWTYSLNLGYKLTPKSYTYFSGQDGVTADNKKHSLFLLSPSVGKSWGRMNAAATADVALLSGGIYYNVGLKGKLFVREDNISSVSLVTGFGSFPNLTFFEQTALRGMSHTNAMVGFDAQWLCTKNMYLGLAGTWNTCYNPQRGQEGILFSSYRNVYALTFQIHVAL